jgi:hypothetical protein
MRSSLSPVLAALSLVDSPVSSPLPPPPLLLSAPPPETLSIEHFSSPSGQRSMRPPRPFLLKSASHRSPRSRTQPSPPPRARSLIPPNLSSSSAPLRGGQRAPPTSAVGTMISCHRLLLLPTVPRCSIHGGALQRGSGTAPHPLPVFCFRPVPSGSASGLRILSSGLRRCICGCLQFLPCDSSASFVFSSDFSFENSK